MWIDHIGDWGGSWVEENIVRVAVRALSMFKGLFV